MARNRLTVAEKLAQRVPGSKAKGCSIHGPLTVCENVCWDFVACLEQKIRDRELEKKINEMVKAI